MNVLTKLELLVHLARWRAGWSRHDSDSLPRGLGPSFLSARDAVAQIPDGAVCFSNGMAGNARCSTFFWALRERFLREGGPRGLTWIAVGAQGGRARVPGTLEELALPGLITRLICGHAETKKALLQLCQDGHCALDVLPQGQMGFLLEAQARGALTVEALAGVGTFLDPRVGGGSRVAGSAPALIEAAGDRLRYHLPRVDVALFNLPWADRDGNLYARGSASLTETRESARAARAAGGKVFASVAGLIPKDPSAIYLRADEVDGIVVSPRNEQTAGVPQRKAWRMFTPESDVTAVEAIERLRFICDVMRITPTRGPVAHALARQAAQRFVAVSRPGALVNIGVGLPEEVCRVVFEAGLTTDVTFMTETGVIGGLPAPGIFFGAAANPTALASSAEAFHRCYRELDTTILGVLQADSQGNVNVSRRGPGAVNYVGPGGLPDLATAARRLLFVGTWMSGGHMTVEGGRLVIHRAGKPKFVDHVDEITFSGAQALLQGKDVWYCTNVGTFRLTDAGMVLVEVAPGLDVKRDILDASPMKIVVPEGGPRRLGASVLTGDGFRLAWGAAS